MEQKNSKLTNEEYGRYSRQLIMKEIGLQGQQKLKAARVLLIGTGGLGSPAALYLAGAGVGTIGLVDADVVDESNLHRQVIHNEETLNVPKVISAKSQMNKFNRHVNVETFQTRFTPQNAMELVTNWDIVMDGSDNAPTRYLISDACVIANKPLVSGSALQWEGQCTVYNYKGGPCYRCLFPVPPPAFTVTNCSDGGVLGMVPGLIGQIQAIEIVKIIIEQGEVLSQRMVIFDALEMKFRNVKIRGRNPGCAACSEQPTMTDVSAFDYDDFCQTNCSVVAGIKLPPDNTISTQKFFQEVSTLNTDAPIIDVRPSVHFGITHLPKAISIPWKSIQKNSVEILRICKEHPKVFIMCRRGNASKETVNFLLQHGISNCINVEGGINAYSQLDPNIPLY